MSLAVMVDNILNVVVILYPVAVLYATTLYVPGLRLTAKEATPFALVFLV